MIIKVSGILKTSCKRSFKEFEVDFSHRDPSPLSAWDRSPLHTGGGAENVLVVSSVAGGGRSCES